tara:strand:+ start:94 stop:561 length:468 start_codon:yes stop_codon:yes gene_type:complete
MSTNKRLSENNYNGNSQTNQQSKIARQTHQNDKKKLIPSNSSNSSSTSSSSSSTSNSNESLTPTEVNNNELEREKSRRTMMAIAEAAASPNPEKFLLTSTINIAYHLLKKDFGYPNDVNNKEVYKTWHFLLTMGCVQGEKQKLLVRLTKVVLSFC